MNNRTLSELLGMVMKLQDEINERLDEVKGIICEEIADRLE